MNHTGERTTVRLDDHDVALFARLSGDRNPLHTSADYARQTPFGEPVAHGALAVLLALAGVPAAEGHRLARLDARFPAPVVPGRSYVRQVTLEARASGGEPEADGDRVTVRLLDGQRPVLVVEASYENAAASAVPFEAPVVGGAVWDRTAAAVPQQLHPGLAIEAAYAPDWAELGVLADAWHLTERGIGPEHVAALAWCSYTAGMELPGESCLLSGITLRFPPTAAPLDTAPGAPPYGAAEVTAFNAGFQALTLRGALRTGRSDDARPFAEAEVHARVRPAPVPSRPDRLAALLPVSECLAGQVAVVVGGSRGLGAALAQALAQQGCTVHLGYHRSDRAAEEVRDSLGERASRIRLARGDCADPAWCGELRDRVAAEHGRCDILVLNACPPLNDMDLTADGGARLVEYARSALTMVQTPLAAFAADVAAAGGTVVGISSAAVTDPPVGWAHYVTAKTALEGLVRSFAAEHPGVRCLLARPPRLRTTLTHAPVDDETPLEPEAAAAALVACLTAEGGDSQAAAEIVDDFPRRDPEQGALRHDAERSRAERKEKEEEDGRLLVAATFTAEPAEPALAFWNEHLGLSLRTEFTPYGQVFQQLLDRDSAFAANRRGCNLVLLRLEDWPADDAQRTVGDFSAAVEAFTRRSRVPLLVMLCPPSPQHSAGHGRAAELAESQRRLRTAFDALPGVHLIDWDHFGTHYRVADHHDAAREKLGHIPYTPLCYTSLATVAMRAVRALLRPPAKVLVLDCDNTLWAGVCGEDGAEGVTLESGHLRLQRWALELRERGVLLCLCSKNHEDDVAAVLRRPDMVLRAGHIAAQRVDWEPKSANLAALGTELGLGLDTFVFLDDNPVETAEVSAAHPQLLSLTLPRAPAAIPDLLDDLWAFDQLGITAEDQQRTQYYQAGRERERFRESALDYADFIRGLGLDIRIAEARPDQTPRISQLTYRTNQFTTTGVRRTEAEVRALPQEGRDCWAIEVSDRFGDYGLVCVAVTERRDDALTVDGLLMSCRVLGRGVEHTVLAHLGEQALTGGYERLDVPFCPTTRNAPARRFLDAVAGEFAAPAGENGQDGVVYRIPAEYAAAVAFRPGEQTEHETTETAAPAPAASAQGPAVRPEALAAIPADLADLTTVHARATAARSAGQGDSVGSLERGERGVGAASGGPAEGVLAGVREVFHDVLRMPLGQLGERVALEALGLSSFTIVDLTVRLEARFGPLPRTLLFEHRTLADVAAAVAGRASPPPPAPAVPPALRPGPAEEPIAVVGIAGRYPGARDLDELAQRLLQACGSVREIPSDRWDHTSLYDPSGTDPAGSYSKWACLLDDVDAFDSLFFRISPREAQLMDPQQRLFLEVAYETLQNAGHTPADLGPDVGVYVGAMAQDYAVLSAEAALDGRSTLPYAANYQIANRVSYCFDFTGPSLVVDTACSSSGTALHLACQDLRRGRVTAALAGGVNLILHPSRHVQYAHMGMLSRTGRCRAFGADADGMVMGEGVGAVLLKPLSHALRDGDHVHALIKGTATNSGGRTQGFTVPSPDAQAELVAAALRDAQVDPATVTLVEAHGTGTPLGDPIEIRGLAKAFGPLAPDRPRCAVGSVKTLIGHLEPAAAVAGLTKVVLQLRHRTIMPSPGASTPNPDIDFDATPFFVPDRPTPWDTGGGPRRAGISSFGAGGVNVHVVVEEYRPEEAAADPASPTVTGGDAAELIVLSARTPERLAAYARRLHGFLSAADPRPALRDVAHTLRVGREPLETRVAFVARGLEELVGALERFAEEGIEGIDALPGACGGRVESGRAALAEVFDDGAEAAAFLAALAAGGELAKLATLWTQGVPIDWHAAFPTSGARRVPLPGYPFASVRHWLPATRDGGMPATAPGLPGERSSDPDRGRTELRWDGSEPYLRDHVIGHRPILPGVLYLEMARAAAERAAATPGFTAARVSAMVWSRPIEVTDGTARAEIAAWPVASADDKGAERIEVIFRDPAAADAETARCTVTAEAADEEPDQDTEGRLSHLPEPEHLDTAAVYADMAARGMEYGPGLRSVQGLEHSPDEALSTLVVPREPGWADQRFVLHPAILDGALQTALVGSGLPGAYLPYSLGELVVRRPPAGTCHAHVSFRRRDAVMIRCDITVVGGDGRTALRLTDLVLLPRRAEVDDASTPRGYRSVWEPQAARPARPERTPCPPRVLVLADDPAREAQWRQAAAADPGSADIVDGGDLDGGLAAGADLVVDYRPHERRGTGDQPWAATVHRLATVAVEERRRLTYLCLTPSAAVDPLAVAASAFGLSGGRETARFRCTRVEIADGTAAPGPERLLAEGAAGEAEVRHAGPAAERTVRRFRAVTPTATARETTAFRPGGTYVISGGAGGIGRALAGHLITAYGATVVLLGRSAPDRLPPLPGPGENGGAVSYLQADVTSVESVRKALARVRELYGPLHGVIHAAGVTEDALLGDKPLASCVRVLAPKVTGTLVLDEATAADDLELFVLMSSTAGTLGNAGQTDYAMANRFLDAFAERRAAQVAAGSRSGRTLSMAWPLWRDGGMRVDDRTVRLTEATTGFQPVGTAGAIRALEEALLGADPMILVAGGDRSRIERTLERQALPWPDEAEPPDAPDAPGEAPPQSVGADLPSTLAEVLCGLAADLLKVSADDMDDDVEFGDVGFDSVLFTEYANRINSRLGLDLAPVVFFDNPTVAALSRSLLRGHGDRLAAVLAKPRPAPAAVPAVVPRATPPRPAPPPAPAERPARATASPAPVFTEPGPVAREGAPEPIAVVGVAGRFPGAPDLAAYWDNLTAGRDQVREVPPDRWDWRAHHGDPTRQPGTTQCHWGGFLDDVYGFDAAFFRITPREAQLMDPQQRLFLEACWTALEDAGQDPRRLAGSRTGVFAGVSLHDYLQVLEGGGSEVVGHTATGNVHSIVPNRVSYLLDLRGPSEAVDTACSSSLVALHRAVGALRAGECDAALAGGVNVLLSPRWYVSFDRAGMLSPRGRCATFDRAADGYVRGEGVGAVVLKRLRDALRDGDTVHAVIRGTAVAHGGRGHSLTAPNATAQADLIEAAYRQAGVSPKTVSFVETHGTGTELGDPIEIEGLTSAFARFADDGEPDHGPAWRCGLGAVKTAIGHLESASGIAGLLKIVLAMRHRTLPPNLHFRELNPYIRLTGTPFHVVDAARPWEPGAGPDGRPAPRRAGLSSFGFGGVNAHVVLEEPPAAATVTVPAPADGSPQLAVVSATGPEQLTRYARRLHDALAAPGGPPPLADIAFTLQTGRPPLAHRLAIVARTTGELIAALAAFADGRPWAGLHLGRADRHDAPELEPSLPMAELAEGWVSGGRVAWERLDRPGPLVRVSLPTYPFDRQPHAVPSPFATGGVDAPPRRRALLLRPVWRPAPLPATPVRHVLADDRPVFLLLLNSEQTVPVTAALGAAPEALWVVVRERSSLPRLARHEYEFDPGADDAAAQRLAEELMRDHPRLDGLVDLADIRSDDADGDTTTVRIQLLRAVLARREGSGPVRLLHLARTTGAERPATARTAGLVRALGAEYATALAVTADVETGPHDGPDQLALVRAELAAMERGAPHGEVRYEGGERRVLGLTELPAPPSAAPRPGHLGPFPLDPGRTYLVTGGTGGLGLATTERLVARGARRIALLGHRPLPPRAEWDAALAAGHERAEPIAAIRRMERAGAEVLTHHGALTDRPSLAAFLDKVRSRLGPVAGVLHCAGVVPRAPQPFVRQEPETVRGIWEPKGEGLMVLDRLLADHHPDFVVLYSSISATVPELGAGLAAYAGANAFLDAHAECSAARGSGPVHRSVAWGSWRGIGVGENRSDAYLRRDLAALDPQEGLDLLERALAAEEPRLLALAAGDGFASDRLLPVQGAAPSAPPAPIETPASPDASTADDRAVDAARGFLLDLFARELLVSREAMAGGATFADLGVDSVFIAGLVGRLEEFSGRPVPPSVILEHDTVDALADHLARTAPAREPAPTPAPAPAPAAHEPVAVIGMAGRYPGAPTLDAYWRLLRDGVCAVREVPADRWDVAALYRPWPEPGRSISRWGGFLDGIEEFDPDHFGIREADAAHMDPLIRAFLECGDTAFRDAGIPREALAGRRIGVFVGSGTSGYGERVTTPEPHTATGLNQNFIAAQLSHAFDLRGPNLVVDTACSSSLTALHLALQSLRLGESDLCLVGGADLLLDETPYLKLSASKALSPNGRCRAFDAEADGIVLGEGVGAVLLKPLRAALADGDRIHAVIEGSAVNNDGRTMGLTTPNLDAQQGLVAEALAMAGAGADTVSYVEAHGTGTMIGDPIELKALTTVFNGFTQERGYCAVGSVKPNIGHLLLASGMAGLHKVVLSLMHRQIPPTLHCDTPNPRFDFADSPFFPNTTLRDWEPRHGVRRAGLSAFGFGGTNAHVVLRELTASERATWTPARSALPPATLRRRRFWLERRRPQAATSDSASPRTGANGHAPHRSPLLALQEGEL